MCIAASWPLDGTMLLSALTPLYYTLTGRSSLNNEHYKLPIVLLHLDEFNIVLTFLCNLTWYKNCTSVLFVFTILET